MFTVILFIVSMSILYNSTSVFIEVYKCLDSCWVRRWYSGRWHFRRSLLQQWHINSFFNNLIILNNIDSRDVNFHSRPVNNQLMINVQRTSKWQEETFYTNFLCIECLSNICCLKSSVDTIDSGISKKFFI